MADKNFPSASEPVKNIVIIGRTGNGKSATGNTLLGQNVFLSKKQAVGVTMKCEMHRAAIQDGPIINVIDTPGLFDLSVSAEYLSKEIINCLTMAEEGIHAVLYVLSAKNRISQEEESTLNTLQRIFESKILDYLIVVFTGGDELEEEDQTLDDYLREGCPEFLTKVLGRCGGRKILLNNKTEDDGKKAEQVKQLLALIADVGKQNDGNPYTDKMHRKIKEENEKLRVKESEIQFKNPGEEELAVMKVLRLQHEQFNSTIEQAVERILKMSTEAHEREMRELKETSRKRARVWNLFPITPGFTLGCNIM